MDREADTDSKDKPPAPWYTRGKSWLLAAGALAGALTAVLGLWDRFFPPDNEDVATIEMVEIIKQANLSDFTSAQLGTSLPLEPASDRAGLYLPATGSESGAASTEEVPTMPPTGPPLPSAEPPSTWEATPPPPERGTAPAPEISSPTPSAGWTESAPWTDDFAGEVVAAPVLTDAGYQLRPDDSKVFPMLANQAMGITSSDAVDPADGRPAAGGITTTTPPVEVVAAQIVEALSLVEGIDSAGNPEPRGWIVAVDLTLEGLDGVPLLLTWSLDGIDIPNSWAVEALAYRVQANTDRDAGTAEIWVPDLTSPGTYKVNVNLAYEADGNPAARGSSPAFPND